MKRVKRILVVSVLLLITAMALCDTFGIITYDEMMVFLRLRRPAFTSAELSVHFIDVGQGDSTLIISGDRTVLIDAGDREGGQSVRSYLVSQNVDHLDYLIATHPHSDHTGGIEMVLESFETGAVLIPHFSESGKSEEDLYAWHELNRTAEAAGITMTEVSPGMTFDLGISSLSVLAPSSDYDEINNYSVVTELVHGENTFLITGDAETESEADMLKNGVLEDIDVLRTGHHGSSTSTGSEFLEIVKPEYAVISCGAGNSYNHPSGSVMKRLGEYGVRVFRTDLQGSVIAESDGKTICFITADKEQAEK
ncbi:ComEC/Rec2 family competence protein [Ruminococcus sp. HUN007]|uniref:ComEC/Rec2 family competence protein n=1 Tax=Ruminococcus sp. HUN007 TaxID=1514668 RepID=UPI0005D1F07E|nr:ComEC/Rec2 family competence protein [Ruminococcus sp. HUN007]